MNGAPDPAEVGTAEQLAVAAGQLMRALDLSGARVARTAGLSAATVSDLINGKAFPREDTFEAFVTRGCGQSWRPWQQAWARAQGDASGRRSAQELAEELEETRRLLHTTREGLASALQRIADLEGRLSRTQAAQQAVEQDLRADRGWALTWLQPRLDRFGPVRLHRESVLYDPRPVDDFFFQVRELARTSVKEMRDYLHESPELLPLSQPEAFGYDRGQVDASVAALRDFVDRYLDTPDTPTGVSGPE